MHKDIPTIGLYRLTDPLGVIEGKQGRGAMRGNRPRFDFGTIAAVLVLAGLTVTLLLH